MALSSLLLLACALTAHAESPLTNPVDEVDEADYQPSLLHHHPSLLLSSKSSKDSFACSDSCALADNGICEDGGYNAESNACAFGSDCSDCGGTPKPAAFPITIRAPYGDENGGRRRAEAAVGDVPDSRDAPLRLSSAAV